MKRIIIDFIPHNNQRYDTCGDWKFTKSTGPWISEPPREELHIFVSQTPDWRSSALVAVHELIEALLCKHAGITTEQVDQFDLNWKRPRLVSNPFTGEPIEILEPGDDPDAPYYNQHQFATEVERELCVQLWLSWAEHEKQIEELK